ncbi:putative secreted protein (Por secretion system target) [Neolewinella xylanilytica]|uniref:Putative secreted protein (Por secretion system target) n=1 Tax=Neolewinella xylanilytica TaxID=1514080 RepID=A0A2S6I6Y7_9BACT|nr:T9SS type A sorting domain-containing protein [Neolewinella xylanilytica]PPK87263.1 putative secreted protein (Por secretion system target) [Neolewinella xylanilytica]
MAPLRCYLLPLLLSLWIPVGAQDMGHSVVSSAGDYFSVAHAGNLHFTLGEIAVSRTENGAILEQGFHRILTNERTTSTWSAPRLAITLSAFPNPTADVVNLTGDWQRDDLVEIRDVFGRLLGRQELSPGRATVALSSYPSGTYFLTLTRSGLPVAGARVVRR